MARAASPLFGKVKDGVGAAVSGARTAAVQTAKAAAPTVITVGAVAGVGAIANSVGKPSPTPEADPKPGAPTPATPASEAPKRIISQTEAGQIYDRLVRFQGVPNPLNDCFQPTHHWRLFMTSQHDLLTQAGNPSNTQALYSVLDRLPSVTIAETGVTGFNIRDVTIESGTGPNFQTRNCQVSDITISIVEPMGVSFMDTLLAAANKLGVQDYKKYWYYLELTWKAYDEDGGVVTNPLADSRYPNGGRWIYQIEITDIEVNLTVTGGEYTLKAQPHSERVMHSSYRCLLQYTRVTGNTIETFFADFANKLNQTWRDFYGVKEGQKPLTTYAFQFHDITMKDGTKRKEEILKMSLVPREIKYYNQRNFDMSTTGAHLPKGASINDIVDFVFCCCEEAQKWAIGEHSGVTNAEQGRVKIVFSVEPSVRITGFDKMTKQYCKDITFHIWGYSTVQPVIDPLEASFAKSPLVQRDIIDTLLKRGYLGKRYDYLFTGMNTEVLNLDLKFNLAWNVVFPQLEGRVMTIDAASLNALSNDEQSRHYSQQLADQAWNIRSEISDLQQQIDMLEKDTKTDNKKRIADIVAKQEELEKVHEVKSEAAARYRDKNPAGSELETPRLAMFMARMYAEDFSVPSESNAALTIPFLLDHDAPEKATGGILPGQDHGGQSTYGAVLSQLYTPLTKQFQSVTLEIRGDPYWLGPCNLERYLIQSDGVKWAPPQLDGTAYVLPQFTDGDNVFLLSYRYPLGLTDQMMPRMEASEAFYGIYSVTKVTHSFTGSEFKQTLHALRLPLVDLFRKNFDAEIKPSTADKTGGGQTRKSPGAAGGGRQRVSPAQAQAEAQAAAGAEDGAGGGGNGGGNGGGAAPPPNDGAAASGRMDVDKAAAKLNAQAQRETKGECGQRVREAIEAGGTNIGTTGKAVDYARNLEKSGWTDVSGGWTSGTGGSYAPRKGDVAIFQPYPGQKGQAGHMQMYDGTRWVSDFKQTNGGGRSVGSYGTGFYAGNSYQKCAYRIFRS